VSAGEAIAAGTDWRELLANPSERAHTVQLYSDLEFLCRAVSHYTATGLQRGEAVILVATPPHQDRFLRELARGGFDVPALTARGQLTLLDAADTLSRLTRNGRPDGNLFRPLIGGVIDRARSVGRFPRVRAFGEMVNLLWERGEFPAAMRLEELWNELGTMRAFALHCAYAMDNFEPEAHGCALGDVHHAHTHLIPVEDYARFDEAVQRALADVVSPAEAASLHAALTAREDSPSRMPAAQRALMDLPEVLPASADAVLSRARRYYATPTAGNS